ncbi:nucleoside triphosphate pyrophosphohydrolase family protein [Actinokineospora spheciospongiae]|nr:hypothetical protein [Actinokineospora spheciospongiae]
MDIISVQQKAWQNKVLKGFNTTDVPMEFCMLQEKVAAAFTAWRRKDMILAEELADVVLYASSIAEMVGLDLGREVQVKVDKNAARSD